jgi:hypothetical protein
MVMDAAVLQLASKHRRPAALGGRVRSCDAAADRYAWNLFLRIVCRSQLRHGRDASGMKCLIAVRTHVPIMAEGTASLLALPRGGCFYRARRRMGR